MMLLPQMFLRIMHLFKFCSSSSLSSFSSSPGLVNLNEKNVKLSMHECKFLFCVCSWSCFKRTPKASRKVAEVGKKRKRENTEIVWKFKWTSITKTIYSPECACIIRELCCSCWLREWFLFFWLLYSVSWLISRLHWFCSIMFRNWLKTSPTFSTKQTQK